MLVNKYIRSILLLITVIGVLLTCIFYALISLVDYNKVSQNMLDIIKISNTSDSVYGQVTLKKFLIPSLHISFIKQDKKVELEEIKAEFSYISLLKLKPQIDHATISRARLYLSDDHSWNIASHDSFIHSLIQYERLPAHIVIEHLEIVDNNGNILLTCKNFALESSKSVDNEYKRKLTAAVDDIGNIDGVVIKKDEDVFFKVKVFNANYEFSLSETYKNSLLIQGGGDIKITNLPGVINSIFPDLRFLLINITQEEFVEVKFDLDINDQHLQFKNVLIKSNAINGSGGIEISKNYNKISNLDFKFSHIDLFSLISINEKQQTTIVDTYNNQHRFVSLNNDIKMQIFVDKMRLSNNESLSSIEFMGKLLDQKFELSKLSCLIDSGGSVKLTGDITGNSVRNIFQGQVEIYHKNINNLLNNIGYNHLANNNVTPVRFSSDLHLTLIDCYMRNLFLQTDDTKMTGNISSKFIGINPRISGALNFSSMNLDSKKYPIVTPILGFFYSLTENMKEQEYFSKFIPLRKISYSGNLDLTFNNLILAKNSFDKVNMLVTFAPGKLDIDNLYINQGKNYISTMWNLDSSGIKPALYIKINDGSVATNSLTVKSLIALKNSALSDYDLSKINFKIDSDSLQINEDGLFLRDTKFSIENSDNVLKINSLTTNIISGKLELEGSILLSPLTLNFVYALNSIDIDKAIDFLPQGILNKTGGGASLNGMFTTRGDTLEELLYNFYTKSDIILKDIAIKNLSIADFINNILKPDYNLQQLNTDYKNALIFGKTDFSLVKSNIEMNRGTINFENIQASITNASMVGKALLNVYDLSINLDALFSFNYNASQSFFSRDSRLVNIPVKINGTLLDLQKSLDMKDIIKLLQTKTSKENNFFR